MLFLRYPTPPKKQQKKTSKGNKIIFQPIDGQNQGVFFVNARCSQLKGRVPPNIGSKEREVLEVVGASGIVLVVDVDSSVVELDADVDSLVELDEVDEPSAAVSSTSCGFPRPEYPGIPKRRKGYMVHVMKKVDPKEDLSEI